jgi:hypothetical protein
MPYTRPYPGGFIDFPNTTTPLTASALNTMDVGIQTATTLAEANRIFTNEAARDAAITSPVEGTRAYLTAPTIPAATGAITAVPTGVQTIYNGSVWVCITPVGANSNTSATTASTTYVTTLTGDATAISVTSVTGTTALISLYGHVSSNPFGPMYVSFSVSGATTIAAADLNGATHWPSTSNYQFPIARTYVFTGLTAGTNTFTLAYKTDVGGGTITYRSRSLTVQGVA